jgi:hypothetical protein
MLLHCTEGKKNIHQNLHCQGGNLSNSKKPSMLLGTQHKYKHNHWIWLSSEAKQTVDHMGI